MDTFENLDRDDEWDEDFARNLIGQSLLVGLTYVEHDGRLIEQKQVFGTVESCTEKAGIGIRLRSSGELFVIAPVLDAIEHGDPGIYRLASTGEEVEDPDFIASITVTEPQKH